MDPCIPQTHASVGVQTPQLLHHHSQTVAPNLMRVLGGGWGAEECWLLLGLELGIQRPSYAAWSG